MSNWRLVNSGTYGLGDDVNFGMRGPWYVWTRKRMGLVDLWTRDEVDFVIYGFGNVSTWGRGLKNNANFGTRWIEDLWNWRLVNPETCGLRGTQKELVIVSSTWQVPASMVRPDMSTCLSIKLWKLWKQNRFNVEDRILRGQPRMALLVSYYWTAFSW